MAKQAKPVEQVDSVIVRFAGDSGDGMQLTGGRFTSETAVLGNDLSTFPDFPAEIRAPAGSLPGVSGFQVHFADHDILTPGDAPNVLVAMNPAALKTNLRDLPRGATLIVDQDTFTERNLAKAGYDANPLEDGVARRLRRPYRAADDDDARGDEGGRGRHEARGRARQEHVRARADVVALPPPDRAHGRLPRAQVREAAGDRRDEQASVPGRLRVRRDDRGLRRFLRGQAREAPAGHLPEHHRQPGARLRADRRQRQVRAAALPRRVSDHACDARSSRSSRGTRISASAPSRPRTRSRPSAHRSAPASVARSGSRPPPGPASCSRARRSASRSRSSCRC